MGIPPLLPTKRKKEERRGGKSCRTAPQKVEFHYHICYSIYVINKGGTKR